MGEANATMPLSAQEIETVKDCFKLFDVDGSGMIEEEELKAAVRELEMNPANDDLRRMIDMVDANGDGNLNMAEFMDMMSAAAEASNTDEENMKYFRTFDTDNTGAISFANIKALATELGETMTDEELRDLLDEGDRDGDGEVGMDEFLAIMKYNSA